MVEVASAATAGNSSHANLCKACGLCCTGHLFESVALRSGELTAVQELGLNVLTPDAGKPCFAQPCTAWSGQCTVYAGRPRACHAFSCALLTAVQKGHTPIEQALSIVEETKTIIREVEASEAARPGIGFRRRLIEYATRLGQADNATPADATLGFKAGVLLLSFSRHFEGTTPPDGSKATGASRSGPASQAR